MVWQGNMAWQYLLPGSIFWVYPQKHCVAIYFAWKYLSGLPSKTLCHLSWHYGSQTSCSAELLGTLVRWQKYFFQATIWPNRQSASNIFPHTFLFESNLWSEWQAGSTPRPVCERAFSLAKFTIMQFIILFRNNALSVQICIFLLLSMKNPDTVHCLVSARCESS